MIINIFAKYEKEKGHFFRLHREQKQRHQELKKGMRNQATADAMRNGIIPNDSSFNQLIQKEKIRRLQAKASVVDVVDNAQTPQDNSNVETQEDWRMVMSKTVGKVFYYNVKTKVGQFSVPAVFKSSMGTLDMNRDSNILSPVITINDESSDENDITAPEIKTLEDIIRPTQTQLPTQILESENQTKLPSSTEESLFQNKLQLHELVHSQTSNRISGSLSSSTRKRGIVSISAIDNEATAESKSINNKADDEQNVRIERGDSLKEDSTDTNNNHKSEVLPNLSESGLSLLSPQPTSKNDSDEFEFDNEVKMVWNCPYCTYENAADAITCDICLAFKPRAKVSKTINYYVYSYIYNVIVSNVVNPLLFVSKKCQ